MDRIAYKCPFFVASHRAEECYRAMVIFAGDGMLMSRVGVPACESPLKGVVEMIKITEAVSESLISRITTDSSREVKKFIGEVIKRATEDEEQEIVVRSVAK